MLTDRETLQVATLIITETNMTIDIVKRLRHTEEETATIGQELVYLKVPVNPDGPEAADEIERLREELARYKYATGVLLTSFNSKWQSRTPAEILRAALEEPQT
jgi:hypothetical protein